MTFKKGEIARERRVIQVCTELTNIEIRDFVETGICKKCRGEGDVHIVAGSGEVGVVHKTKTFIPNAEKSPVSMALLREITAGKEKLESPGEVEEKPLCTPQEAVLTHYQENAIAFYEQLDALQPDMMQLIKDLVHIMPQVRDKQAVKRIITGWIMQANA